MSDAILEALRKGPWREPAHAWLYEVRNRTGYSYGGRERYADALVVSCFPSRGLWLAGVEVKVSRSDWRRELDDPTKSSAIQRYCDYWWIAAPPGVVQTAELPETWGLQEIDGKKVRTIKKAPKLTPLAPDLSFLASVLRQAAESQNVLQREAHADGYKQAAEEHGSANLQALQAQVYQLEHDLRMAKADAAPIEEYRANVALFERTAGMHEGTIGQRRWDAQRVLDAAQAYAAAQLISTDKGQVDNMERRLRVAADALAELKQPPRAQPGQGE